MTGTGAVYKRKSRLLAPFMEAREVGQLQKIRVQRERALRTSGKSPLLEGEPIMGGAAPFLGGGAIYRR